MTHCHTCRCPERLAERDDLIRKMIHEERLTQKAIARRLGINTATVRAALERMCCLDTGDAESPYNVHSWVWGQQVFTPWLSRMYGGLRNMNADITQKHKDAQERALSVFTQVENGKTRTEVAKEMGLSRGRICQLYNKGWRLNRVNLNQSE